MKNKALAWLNLAYRFVVHVAVRMPVRALGSNAEARRFLAAVEPEGYVPLQAHERDLMPRVMRCVHCGLCSLACAPLRTAPRSAWEEPWTFVVGAARSIERGPLAAAAVQPCAHTSDGDLVCPTGVPIQALGRTIERLAGRNSLDPPLTQE
jgi:hypothetical protein